MKNRFMALLSAVLILMAGSGIGTATVQSSSPTITETRITTNPSNSWEPSIYGNKIVWTDDRNGNNDIYIQDLSTKEQIHTTNKAAQHSPDIYEIRLYGKMSAMEAMIFTCRIFPLPSKLGLQPVEKHAILKSTVTGSCGWMVVMEEAWMKVTGLLEIGTSTFMTFPLPLNIR